MYSFIAIIYPIFVSLILINVNDSLVVNLSNYYWTFNFSYENKSGVLFFLSLSFKKNSVRRHYYENSKVF